MFLSKRFEYHRNTQTLSEKHLLKKVNQELGITVICNLHFLSLVRQYATRVVALKDGRVVFEGKAEDISNDWFARIYGQDAKEVHIN